jgi:hypothetical protein
MLKSWKSRTFVLIIMIFLFGLSCHERSDSNPSKIDNTTLKTDSFVVGEDNFGNILPNTLFPKDFAELRKEFNKDSNGRLDSTREIPRALIWHFIKEQFDSSLISSVNPVLMIKNTYGYFFIIKENCGAGGECASFDLLAFDIRGKIVKSRNIGMLAAEEADMIDFRYKITSDTSLITYKIHHDFQKDKDTDSAAVHVKLTFP